MADSWVVDRSKSTAKRKKREQLNSKPQKVLQFNEHIVQRYNEYVKELETKKQTLAKSLQEKSAMLLKIADSKSRGRMRDKVLLEKQIDNLLKEQESFDADKLLEEFKKTLMPYIYAYEREQQLAQMNQLKGVSSSSVLQNPKQNDVNNLNGAPQNKKMKSLLEQVTVVNSDESHVFKEYLEGVENVAPEVKIMHREICEECDEVMVLETRSSVIMCPYCSNWKPYLDATSSHMAYGEEVEFSSFAYLRLNHFNERLTYAQAKETNQIPQEIINRVMVWLYEHNVTKTENVTLEMTYHAMKELKLRSYYKQNTQLWCRITGNPALRMSPEHEEHLRLMFKAVQRLWPKYKPDNRKNFLSYNYCLYKFNQLLGYDEFLPYFKLLKGPKKLQKQDEIFQKMCQDPELKWEFLNSKI